MKRGARGMGAGSRAALLAALCVGASCSAGPEPGAAPPAGMAAAAPAGAASVTSDPCRPAGPLAPSPDLYCMTLTPVPGLDGVTAELGLGRIPGPFTVAVTPDGRLRYRPTLRLEGMPPAASLGDFEGYVAWLTTPVLTPERRLGVVREGVTVLGETDLDKFLVLVTAEPDTASPTREGRLVLRGQSPSTRMQPADVLEFALGSMVPGGVAPGGMPGMPGEGEAPDSSAAAGPDAHGGHGAPVEGGWILPPMLPGLTMLPAMMALRPEVEAFRPAPRAGGPMPARPSELIRLGDGDTLTLVAEVVERVVDGYVARMYAFNGQYPGPLIHVSRGSTIVVDFTNRIDLPTTVHWHGIRLDNRFDGVPGLTQDAVRPGETFRYEVHFPDAGLYWYHPHAREDVQQDLGLYGNMLVRDTAAAEHAPAHREEVLMLDDLLVAEEGLVPHGRERATHGFMGRFGNLMLVNGEPRWEAEARPGEVVRFLLTNVANTRTFNLSFRGPDGVEAPLEVIGTDVGLFQREEAVGSVVIAPAERYTVHARFDRPGEYRLLNRVRGIDHLFGAFFPVEDTLGVVRVSGPSAEPGPTDAFDRAYEHPRTSAEIEAYRSDFARPVDKSLELVLETGPLPLAVERLMQFDSTYFHPVEWSGTMPMMNWASTEEEARWNLFEPATGRRGMDIRWDFRVGEVAKIRIHNRRHSLHAMQHPIHFHGQRFLVLSVNGVENDNLAWKDTVLVPTGATVDILLELSNPGAWMAHCHIAEHLEAGMMMRFDVG